MMQTNVELTPDLIQGTPEWFALRKTKITATDASAIMGVNPWKTALQLYNEKLSDDPPKPATEAMQRGIDLEPIARDLYNIKTGLDVIPTVLVWDWAMASLDGRSSCEKYIVEIKCPGPKDHALALSGEIPDHYYPQLQHQMYVAEVGEMDYFSFDGTDGVIITVKRDNDYIAKMIEKELKFYECLMTKTPPELEESDYIERTDKEWEDSVAEWKTINEALKKFQEAEEKLRAQLIALSQGKNSKGSGISLCQIKRKGAVEYYKIPFLNGIDLDRYRKPATVSWRITA